MKSRALELLDKSVAAMLAAIEIYNKPSFFYREEAFSIMSINSWELLLKARILQLDRNRLSSIMEYERRQLADGSSSEKLFRKKNRSNNYITIGLFKAHDNLINIYKDNMDPSIRINLEAMVEVRDNGVHFINKEFDLKKKVHELGSANLKNYLNLVRIWFGRDLSQYQIFLLPLAFIHGITPITGITSNKEERNILEYIKTLESGLDDNPLKDFNLSIDVDINIRKVTNGTGMKVVLSREPDAIPITMQEEDIRARYPWDYGILTQQLRLKYLDFIENQKYHDIRKALLGDSKYTNPRYLDPGNPKSAKKVFFNPNIIKEFDKHYTRRPIS